jgi:hypothetical protein
VSLPHTGLRFGVMDEQTPEELDAQYGDAGPVAAGTEWFSAILEQQSLRAAWPKTDPVLRLVMVQAWIWANRWHPLLRGLDRNELAAKLASEEPTHPLWSHFEAVQLREFHETWEGFNLRDWGASSRPRPIAPDYEIVLWIETGGEVLRFEEATLVENAIILLMHSTPRGWIVAAAGSETPPVPGWPPQSRP